MGKTKKNLHECDDVPSKSSDFIEVLFHSLFPLIVTDRQAVIIEVNRLFTEEFGFEQHEVTGKKMDSIYRGEFKEAIDEMVEVITKDEGAKIQIEAEIVRKDGKPVHVLSTCMNLKMHDDPGHIIWIAQNITDRKEVELNLKKLSSAVEQSPASVIITDIKGTIEYVNPKFTALTGYTLEEAIGKNPRILKSGIQAEEFYRDLWTTVLSGNEWRGEFHNRKKNGELYWEFASISPLRNHRGEVTHFIAVKEDITARKNAEEALKISEENLRKKNQLMARELNNAQTIIKLLLPSEPPKNELLKTEYRYIPLEEVGGDYFSFYPFQNNDGMGVFICDVSGHGVSAALFLSLVKSVTDRLARKYYDNAEHYLHEMNIELLEGMSTYFLTAIYGFFSFNDGAVNFTFSKAGHPPPVLWKRKDNSTQVMKTRGSIIGYFADQKFDQVTIRLERGDRIFLFTDGLVEAIGGEKKMFGYNGIVDVIVKTAGLPLPAQLDNIIEEINIYRGEVPNHDDIILIGFEVTG